MAEQVWRPRFCVRAQGSGSPRVPVRPYYEGPPSQEGRYGPDEGRRKPPGSRGWKPSVRTWRDGPGVEDATVERREAACLAKARGTFYEVPDLRRSANRRSAPSRLW